jgi:hypothetical protein
MSNARDNSEKGVGLSISQVTLSVSNAIAVLTAKTRVFAEVKNLDASIVVYIGGDGAVTSATGRPLAPGEAVTFSNYVGPLYAIAASGTPKVSRMEW